MQFIKSDINLDIIGKRKIGFYVSASLILASILSLIIHGGPKYGIDFAGGTVIQLKFSDSTSPDAIKSSLKPINMHKASVQQFGEESENEFLVRADVSPDDLDGLGDKIKSLLEKIL